MGIVVSNSRVVATSVDKVFAYMDDYRNVPRWLFGITRFEQLAKLSEGDLDRLDQHLGAFKGRLERDQVPLQADYLARGDEDGFEQRFGKL